MGSEYERGEARKARGAVGDPRRVIHPRQLDPVLVGDVDALLVEVGRLLPLHLPVEDAAWKVAAVACLARCRELLGAALASHHAGFGGVAIVLLRSLYEVWLWGQYLLAAQEEAVSRLMGEREWHIARMSVGETTLTSVGVALGERERTAEGEPEWTSMNPNLRDLAGRVANLRGSEERAVVLAVYESLWRRASFVGAHPSWAVLERYTSRQRIKGYASVEPSALPWADEEDNVITHTCASLVLDLAEQVLEGLGLPQPKDGLDQVRRRLAEHRW